TPTVRRTSEGFRFLRCRGRWRTLTATSATSSGVRPKRNLRATRASVAAYGSIRTATTRSTPRQYGDGGRKMCLDKTHEAGPSSDLPLTRGHHRGSDRRTTFPRPHRPCRRMPLGLRWPKLAFMCQEEG